MGLLEDLLARLAPGGPPAIPTPLLDGSVPLPRPRPKEADGALVNDAVDPAALPANSAPTAGTLPALSGGPAEQPSIFGRLMSGLHDNSNTLLALGAGFAGAPNIGQGISRAAASAIPASQQDLRNKLLLQGQNQTYTALIKRGVPQDVALAAMQNPEILKQVLPSVFGSKEYGFQMTPDGTLLKTDKGTGQVTPAYQTAPKLIHQTLPDGTVLEIDPTGKTAPKPVYQSGAKFTYQTLPDGTILQVDPLGKMPPKPVYQSTKPTFGVIGKDSNGNDIHGFIDPITQKVSPVSAQGIVGPGSSTPSNSDLTGEEFLKTLDPGRANQIKAIADGRMAPPGGMSLKSPQIQGLLRDVAQYEPGFDLASWKAREATRTDLAKGKMGQNVTAFNTAIGHLETLDKAADALGNRWSPTWNSVANMIENATGDARVKQFDVAKTAVADELTRAFRGSGGNVHDLVQWENAINSSNSPAQLKAAIKQATELLRSRIEAVGDQYNRGMGKTTDPIELLSPKAKAGILRLSGGRADAQPATAPNGKTSSGVTWSVVQ